MTTRASNLALGLIALLSVPFAVTSRAEITATEQSKSAAQIFTDSENAMRNAKSFHALGHFNDGGTATSLNLSMSPAGGGGSVQLPGVTMELVVTSATIYLKADEQSWLKLTGSQPTAELVANRWIKASKSNPDFSSLADLTNSKDFIGQLTAGASELAKLPATASWGGYKAIVLTDGQGDRLYVADTSTPYMLHLQGEGSGSSGAVSFSDFGKAPMPTMPVNAITLPGTS